MLPNLNFENLSEGNLVNLGNGGSRFGLHELEGVQDGDNGMEEMG